MNSIIFVAFSIFAGVQSQIFAPAYPRTVPAMMPGCPCGKSAPMPVMKLPCDMPLALPAPVPMPRPVAKAPCGCDAALPAVLPAALPAVLPATLPAALPAALPATLPAALPATLPYGLPLANPFLPAASPVSALAPFSPLLPPANTCSRCQFLKKIPIPPPCI